jgi:hypothetical protein
MKLTHTEIINASRETVFSLLSDPAKQLLWRDGLVAIELLASSPAKTGVGTQTVEIFHKGRKKTEYRISSEVTALDAPDVYTTRISNDDFFGDITYLLEPVGCRHDLRGQRRCAIPRPDGGASQPCGHEEAHPPGGNCVTDSQRSCRRRGFATIPSRRQEERCDSLG